MHAWRRADEPPPGQVAEIWDYALEPWLAQAKLRWCEPGSDRSVLSTAPATACPFARLPGVRRPQFIAGERRR